VTYNELLADDFQFELDRFFERLNDLQGQHGATDEDMLAVLFQRGTDLDDQYRDWIEEGES